ncbi:MAG: HD domain-containing protein [bacterium]
MKLPDFEQFIVALEFAARKHRDQRRKDREASPYINHPIQLVWVLVHEGQITDPDVLCAALLHDTIEDTETTRDELVAAFGASVASIVDEVTDDKSLEKHVRKQHQVDHAPHLTRQAKLVKLADKIANVRDVVISPPQGWPIERQQEYFDWAKRVVDGLRGTNAALEAAFDEAYSRRPQ